MNQDFATHDHLSDEDLLAWADGELEGGEDDRVASHLTSCEPCRERAALLAKKFCEYAEYRSAVLSGAVSTARLPDFERIRNSAGRQLLTRRLKPAVTSARYWRIAAGIAAVLIILILSHRSSGPSVSGNELLTRAMAADLSAAGSVTQPVCFQKLHLRRSSESGTVETWSRRDRFRLAHKGGGRVWTEFASVYANNGMGGHRPLSPAAFQAWSGSLRQKTETVTQAELAGGAEALEITTKAGGAVPTGRLLEASLVVRARDWHPVRQTLRVQGDGQVQELEVRELAFQVVPAATLGPEILSALDMALPALPPQRAAAPGGPAVSAGDPDKAEIEALLALHRVHACKGEPIEIRHAGSSLAIHGIVDSADRKAEVVQALRGIPGLRLEIRSAEEHLRQAGGAPATAADAPDAQPAAPAADDWHSSLPPELVDVANRAVSLADDALVEVWALRRLAEAFPGDRIVRLGPDLRVSLETMVRDHAAALRQNLAETRSLLANVAPGATAPVRPADRFEWPAGMSSLFAAVEQERESVRALFANLRGTGREQAAARFAETIAAAERGAAQLERDALLLLPHGTEPK